ncbi:MAG: hypothetical protein Q9217_006000, partial [Psora testacea]
SLLLTVSYPQTYPETPPELTLAHAPNTRRPLHLTLPADAPRLLASLQDSITDSLGTAMIFTLLSTLKENTEALISSRLNAVQASKDAEAAKEEEAENAKFAGEKVTKERFEEWRERFRSEMEERRDEEERRRVEEEGGRVKKAKIEEVKLTGRQLWERGLVGKVEEEGEDENDALVGVEKLKVEG